LVLSGWLSAFPSLGDIQYAGVNLSGAEFGQGNLPGTFGSDYTYPTQAEVDYFRSKGMNIIRLPFRWERLQHTNNIALDATELSRLNTFVSATTAKGVYVILDPHNFERYYPDPNNFQSSAQGLVGSAVANSVFTNFWGQVAGIYKTNNRVIFGLMNEPNSMPTEQLVASENAAIAAIRATGATNLILVPGNAWTGAASWFDNWYGTPNATAMLNIVDPGNNYAFEAHQYLDSDGSGTTTNIVSATIGAERLANFTQWLRSNHRQGFLGEFAAANSMMGTNSWQIGDETLTNMLTFVQTNSDVWLGWTWWAGGPWWNGGPGNPNSTPVMIFLLDPANLGQPGQTDKPAMAILKSFIPIPAPALGFATTNKFRYTTQSGFVYQPQFSTNLANGNWANNGSSVTGTNGLAITNAVQIGTGSPGFYRVSVTHVP
jgi:endoglucanase